MNSSPKSSQLIDSIEDHYVLKPITPAHTCRYSKTGKVTQAHRNIPAGFLAHRDEPQRLCVGWIEGTQAEGQRYYYHKEGRFVTDANINNPEIHRVINVFMDKVKMLSKQRDFQIKETMETMLQLEDEPTECGYYIVDHDLCTMYWLEDVSTEDLGFLPVTTANGLHWACKESYWNHVEYFPAHISGIKMSHARELLSILTHARADHLTSASGTFPYGAEKCKEFYNLLRDHVSLTSDLLADPYVICTVARLWGQVARNRSLNFYGEDQARLSRESRVVEADPKELPYLLQLLGKTLLFDFPSSYAADLQYLWNDAFVYNEPCKVFNLHVLKEYKEDGAWSLGTACISIILSHLSEGSRVLMAASVLCSSLGFLSSLLLAKFYRMRVEYDTEDAFRTLNRMNHSVYGLAPFSILLSVPKALTIWSTGLVTLQMLASFVYPSLTLNPSDTVAFAFTVLLTLFAVLVVILFVSRCSWRRSSSWRLFSCFFGLGSRSEDERCSV